MSLLLSVYVLLMTFFVLEDNSLIHTIANNFHSLSIYKPY